MCKRVILAFLLFLPSLLSIAGEGEYAISKIPAALLKNANAVIRLEERTIELQRDDKLAMVQHYVITILNEEGSRFATLVEDYDRFTDIRSIEGCLYDADGNKTKTLKGKDILDLSGGSGMSLADDIRFKKHDFYCKLYPYTVEYTIKKIKTETMFFPSWVPVWEENISVERSVISVKVPAGYLLRYKPFNYNHEPVNKTEDEKKIYTWEVSNYEAVKKEFASPGWTRITPSVLLAPSEFVIEDYRGNMSDWNELGKFQNALNKGRNVLPDIIKQKVAALVRNAVSVEDKVKRLYQFLQANTRYVSIQLGIGGWRPFEASYVAAKSYGDCKALSNYMTALLTEAGIISYYTLVKAGEDEDDIITDFPCRQFNHAIVCVPNGKDTIWLECTSQNTPAGYMGSFTGNRHALLITEDGGKLAATPKYGMKENTQLRKLHATLNEDATLNIRSKTEYRAIQQDEIQMMINSLSKDKVKEFLHKELDFATYEISHFDYKETRSSMPAVEESLDIIVSNYATITGKRLFIIPNIMTRTHRKLPADEERKYDLELGFAYKNIDTVEINLPAGYTSESMPQDVSVSSKFGKYTCSARLLGTQLFYYRSMEYNGGRFPAKDYGELVKFYETIYKADRNKVVLVKNGE